MTNELPTWSAAMLRGPRLAKRRTMQCCWQPITKSAGSKCDAPIPQRERSGLFITVRGCRFVSKGAGGEVCLQRKSLASEKKHVSLCFHITRICRKDCLNYFHGRIAANRAPCNSPAHALSRRFRPDRKEKKEWRTVRPTASQNSLRDGTMVRNKPATS